MKTFAKHLVKKVFGLTNVKLMQDFFEKLFRTANYKSGQDEHKRMIEFYSKFVKPGDLCFDIGAHFGSRTSVFIDLGAKVVSVEPQKACCKYLKKKFGDSITLINKAVGSKKEMKTFYISFFSSTLSSLSAEWIKKVKTERFKDVNWDREEVVEVTTLDALISEFGMPVFVKIDVEGFEHEVLKGLNKEIKAVSFEYTVPERIDKAIECLKLLKNSSNNLRCNLNVGDEMEFRLKEWINIDDMAIYLSSDNMKNPSAGDLFVISN